VTVKSSGRKAKGNWKGGSQEKKIGVSPTRNRIEPRPPERVLRGKERTKLIQANQTRKRGDNRSKKPREGMRRTDDMEGIPPEPLSFNKLRVARRYTGRDASSES